MSRSNNLAGGIYNEGDNTFTLPTTRGADSYILTRDNTVDSNSGKGTTWKAGFSAHTITSVTTPASDNSINVDDNVVMTVTGTNFADAGMTAKLVDASNEASVVTGHDVSDLSINYSNTTSISVTTRAATANISQSNVKLVITKSGISVTSTSIGVSPDPTITSLSNPHATLVDNLGSGQNVGSAISASASDGASITYSISGATSAGNTYLINSTSGQITTPSAGIADVSSGTSYSESPTVTATAGGDSTRTETISVPLVINKYVSQFFSGYAYTGASSNQNISLTSNVDNSVDSKPDFVWIKERNSSSSHRMFDTVRGPQNNIGSNEVIRGTDGGLTAFLDDGFTDSGGDGATNESSSKTYVSWAWKAGGTPTATNTNINTGSSPTGAMTANSVSVDGQLQTNYTPSGSPSIYPYKMSVNTTEGFSIINYKPNGTMGDTLPHGLTSAPELIIVKDISADNDWVVYHSGMGHTKYMRLNADASELTSQSRWNNTLPTNSVVTLGVSGHVNGPGTEYIMYCFHSVSNLSSFGTLTGNGTTDVTKTVGFQPRFVIIKNAEATGHWIMWDSFRGFGTNAHYFKANDSIAEVTETGRGCTVTSTSFTPKNYHTENTNRFIYMAWA